MVERLRLRLRLKIIKKRIQFKGCKSQSKLKMIEQFPVAGCPGRVDTRTAMRVHFVHRHVLDTVVILEEGNFPHPRYARCDMLVPWQELNGRHLGTAQCNKGEEQKRRRMAEAETC